MDRNRVQQIGFAVLTLSAIAVVAPILIVIGIILVEGAKAISWGFIFSAP